jgi:PAS domain S-box-containing protein
VSDETRQRISGPPVGGEEDGLVEQFHRMSAQLAKSYAALQESEERFSLAMRGANDGLWDWDVRSGEVYYSPRWKAMLGYSEDELEPAFSAWERLVHPDDKPAAMKGVEAFLSGELDKFEIEFRMRHKDGHDVDILSRAFGVREVPGGPMVRLVGTHIDITERRQAEEEIRRQNEYLAALHETTLGVVSRLDLAELLETLVERAVNLFGAADGFVYLVKSDEDRIELTVGAGMSRQDVGVRLKRGEGLAGKVWELGQSLAVEDYRTWPGRSAQFDEQPVGPEVAVPLRSGPDVVGVIGVARLPLAPPFQQDEMDRIVRFAHLASIALDNARLHTSLEQRVQERTHELETLNAVAAVVSSSLNLEEILSDALDQTMNTLNMEFGVAYRLEGDLDGPEEQLYLNPLVHRGFSEPFVRAARPIPLWVSSVGEATACGQPVVWEVKECPGGSEREQLLWAEGGRRGVSTPLTAKGRLAGAMQLFTGRGQAFTPEQLSLLAAIGQQVGLAVENARLYEVEHERYEEAERRRQVAAGMRETLAAINSRQSLPEILDFIVRQACGLLGCDATAVQRLESKEGPLQFQSACGLDTELVSSLVFPSDLSVTGQVLQERHPIAVPDTAAHAARVTREHDWPPEPQRALLQQHVNRFPSLLSVPLVVRDDDYGVFTFYYREPHRFSEEEVQLAQSIADQAALAIESARLRARAEQAAALAERSRLARELHDSVTQSLYSVTMYTEAAARLLTTGQEAPATEYLRDARDTAQEALREMRLLIFELRPLALEESGLAGALQARLDAVEKRGGVQAELRVEGVEGMADAEWLPLSVQQELYHVAQEALNNSLKHAKAQHLQVCLGLQGAVVRLEISDDGVGFDPATAGDQGGLGLRGMRERVQRIGGQLQIESAPDQGSKVTVEVSRERKGDET